jgi:hypothetical protein
MTNTPITEAERRRRLGETYALLLALAAKRRAQPAANTTAHETANHDQQNAI